jgi:hypothetical protein
VLPATPRPQWRGWDSNPRSRAHEAREDSRSSTAQIWLAGFEPAVSGVQGRRVSLLPYSQVRTSDDEKNAPADVDMTDLTRLFMPLAHPSALERRRERTTSYVEGSWSPMLDGVTRKRRATVTRGYSRAIQRQTVEDLSLSSGASIEFGTSQAEHHLLIVSRRSAFRNKEGDPLGRPVPAVVSRAGLAGAPRGQGEFIGVRSLLVEAMPTGLGRRGLRRLGEEMRFVQKK